MKREAVIVAYGRSAVCRARKGSFANVHPLDYMAQVINGVMDKVPQLEKKDIDDIVIGCAIPENKLNKNVARLLALRAGFPYEVCGQTINRFCCSSLEAVSLCVNAIENGQQDIMIAGGVEQMSMQLTRGDNDSCETLNSAEPGAYMSMGMTAENVVKHYGVSRERMDAMAVQSHAKAAAAQKSGLLAPSIIPVKLTDETGETRIVSVDEGIREGTNLEKLATLKPCFVEDGSVTAANSSQTSDGASFAIVMSAEKAKELGIKPIAKLLSYQVAGCDPKVMGLGAIYAVPKAMNKTGFTVSDMDVIELNEAFAAMTIPCIDELELDESKVNPYGGAMALGHPMGATGVFLMCKALDYLKANNGKHALITMCIGGGMGAAGILELME
ncbi:thiolase family protein [Photobacterium sp. DNB23_23_1]